jgi:hypothetical protein
VLHPSGRGRRTGGGGQQANELLLTTGEPTVARRPIVSPSVWRRPDLADDARVLHAREEYEDVLRSGVNPSR